MDTSQHNLSATVSKMLQKPAPKARVYTASRVVGKALVPDLNDYWATLHFVGTTAMTVDQAIYALNKLKEKGHGSLELHVVYKGEARAAAIDDESYVIVHELSDPFKGSLIDAPDGTRFIPIYIE